MCGIIELGGRTRRVNVKRMTLTVPERRYMVSLTEIFVR